ncbi:lipase secretion chaperone [Rhodoferax sp.]|uniref:lipase secretion chaperone n=1 Tax=Rhodoferax sp. TaxID=50421 RepID=UPI00272878AA|nr:lipase secretion chaperone [Rhodoferax sp.]MDO9195137.1 lipase secretion chaperone [Rhodoferax sp.]
MKLSQTRVSLGLLGLALMAAGLVMWQNQATETTSVVDAAERTNSAFVRSMQDTVPDGDLRALQGRQQHGQTAPLAYAELKRLFDYYLSAVGEQSIEAITQQISSELERRLPADQAREAKRLLALYLEFKRELVALEQKPELAGSGVQAIRRRLMAMQDLRSGFFSAQETQGMFGFDDAYDMDAVARLEISQNPALSDAQKKEQLAALDAAMPAALRNERDASRVVVRIEQMAEAMRAKGANEDEVYRMRARELDPQAASRLAEVDREEQAWKSRIAIYLNERSRLLQVHADGPDSQRQLALTQLQQSQFTPEERRRLAAYEQ